MMMTFNQMVKEFVINGRGGDTEDTRAKGITEEIVKRFMVEADCSMNAQGIRATGVEDSRRFLS